MCIRDRYRVKAYTLREESTESGTRYFISFKDGQGKSHELESGQIVNCCQPNALMTLKEYLEDYASADTKEKGEKVIQEQLEICLLYTSWPAKNDVHDCESI